MSKRGPNQRLRRVNEILRSAIADEVHDLKDPRLGFLTVTGVEAAPDLRNAIVYYSVLGDDEVKEGTAAALAAAASRVRAAVGGRVRIKYLPELRFVIDPSIEQGERIDRILREIEGERASDEA